ncbi:Uncharacterized protein GBIM_09474, partial [Gryllus bimaculatus]
EQKKKRLKAKKAKKQQPKPSYAVRERIVLSCLVHLLIPRTLFDLHYLLPPSEKELLDITHRVPALFKLKKKRIYESPYLEPQPVLVATHMKKITEETEKLIDTLESRGDVNLPINADFNKESHCEQVERRITYEQKKINHFQTVKEQLRQQAIFSPIKLYRNYAVLQEEENSFYRQLSYLPTLNPTFPNETYSSLRYSTSTEIPDTSALAQIQEPRDQTFVPMMSLKHCATSWDSHSQSDVQGAMVPPITHVIVDENTTPVQIKALEGYFHAYPQTIPYKTPRLKPLTTINPLSSRDYMDYLKKALQYLAKRGNPLAALPDAHLIPHIHKWILKRYRFKMTPNFEGNLFKETITAFEKGRYRMKLVHKPRRFLCKIQYGLTWDRRIYLQKLARRVKGRFYGQVQTTMVNDARKFWPVMFMKYYDERKFRDTYFAYLPSKQRDNKECTVFYNECMPTVFGIFVDCFYKAKWLEKSFKIRNRRRGKF